MGNDGPTDSADLARALNEETIKLDVDAEDWEGAVRAAGQLLLNQSTITGEYVEAMVRAIRELGPYMVVAPGIALAHGRPEDGVNDICMSLVRLSNPVEFGAEVNDPVDLVFALGGVDEKSHLGLLSQLAKLLQDEARMEQLRACQSAEEAARIVGNSAQAASQ